MRSYQRVIELDKHGQVSGLTISQHMLDMIDLPQDLLDSYYPAFCRFGRLLQDDKYVMRFTLRATECIVFDNHRIVHGRAAYSATSGERYLRGCYADRAEMRSTYRALVTEGTVQSMNQHVSCHGGLVRHRTHRLAAGPRGSLSHLPQARLERERRQPFQRRRLGGRPQVSAQPPLAAFRDHPGRRPAAARCRRREHHERARMRQTLPPGRSMAPCIASCRRRASSCIAIRPMRRHSPASRIQPCYHSITIRHGSSAASGMIFPLAVFPTVRRRASTWQRRSVASRSWSWAITA